METMMFISTHLELYLKCRQLIWNNDLICLFYLYLMSGLNQLKTKKTWTDIWTLISSVMRICCFKFTVQIITSRREDAMGIGSEGWYITQRTRIPTSWELQITTRKVTLLHLNNLGACPLPSLVIHRIRNLLDFILHFTSLHGNLTLPAQSAHRNLRSINKLNGRSAWVPRGKALCTWYT